jgi:hypothetical protein
LIALLVKTPPAYVVLSGSSRGQALEKHFRQRLMGIVPVTRFCRGVLLLPKDHAAYLRGRRRQAVRTNLRRAAAAGIQCEVVSDPRRAVDDVAQVWRRQWGWLPEAEFQARINDVSAAVARSELTIAVARDQHGRPVAMAAAIIDDTVCLIKHAVATTHEARWALHDHIVRVLIAQRVRYLLADGGGPFGALGFDANVQHYQHLLGYELRHVVPVRARRMRRKRLAASLVVVAAGAAILVPRAVATTGASDQIHPTTSHPVVDARESSTAGLIRDPRHLEGLNRRSAGRAPAAARHRVRGCWTIELGDRDEPRRWDSDARLGVPYSPP